MIPELKKTSEQKMQKSLEALKADLGKVRTGRAHTGILDHVQVDYYGSMVPITQVANIPRPVRTAEDPLPPRMGALTVGRSRREATGVVVDKGRKGHPAALREAGGGDAERVAEGGEISDGRNRPRCAKPSADFTRPQPRADGARPGLIGVERWPPRATMGKLQHRPAVCAAGRVQRLLAPVCHDANVPALGGQPLQMAVHDDRAARALGWDVTKVDDNGFHAVGLMERRASRASQRHPGSSS